MDYHYYQLTGACHRAENAMCQDVFANVEDSEYSLIALADGVSVCRNGRTGAERTLDALWDFIRIEGSRIFEYTPRKLSYLLLEHVRYFVELASVEEADGIDSFSSTLIFACAEKKTGRVVAGNLGDGGIWGFWDHALRVVSAPGRYANKTFVTTSKFAHKAMDLYYHHLSPGDSILLGSDGFVSALRRSSVLLSGAMENFELEKLDQYLEEFPEADDCTYVAVRRPRQITERN